MDLRTHILALVAPTGIGDELIPGVRLVGSSTELGPRLSFEVGGCDVHVDVEPISPSRPSAARSRRLMFSYRSATGERHVEPLLGKSICTAVAKVAVGHEEEVLGQIAAAGRAAAETGEGATRVRELRVERLLEPAGTPERRYYTLSPYVGCLIGCRFCYAQSRVGIARELEGLPSVPWGSYVDVRINAADVLERELEALAPAPLKFCPIVSDPYQAVERRYRITRKCLEVIRDARTPRSTFVLTRSRLLAEDADLLAALPDGRGGVSIPTIDDAVRAHFEPRGAPIAERLSLLRTLRAAGARTFAVVQPLLPGSVVELADALAETVSSVSIDVLRGVEGAEDDFDASGFVESRDQAWQMERALELRDALERRGIAVWSGELPSDVR